jgi:hypothetical protein
LLIAVTTRWAEAGQLHGSAARGSFQQGLSEVSLKLVDLVHQR